MKPFARSAAPHLQAGLSLVETMVALMISMVILSAVGYLYATQRVDEHLRRSVTDLQAGAGVIFEALRRDLLQAGYVGCNSNLVRGTEKTRLDIVVRPLSPVVLNGVDNFTVDAGNAIRVFNGDAAAAVWGGSAPPDAVPDSHVIEVRYATAEGASYLAADIPADGMSLRTTSTVELGRGDDSPTSAQRMGLLSDCANGMIVSVASIADTSVTVDPSLPISTSACQHASRVGSSCVYWPAAMLMPVRVVQYYVAEGGTAEAPRRGLFVRKRIMDPAGLRWNAPVQIADGLNALRVFGLGMDVAAPADPTWRVAREILEGGTPSPETLPADEWPRVLRLDVRLSMRTDPSAGRDGRPTFRNYETSFAVRGRTAAERL